MDLEVTEVGSGDALVVFVHGVLGRGRSFDRVADVLAPVAIDGHIADLLSVLDGRRAVVVGHSFGGVTAMGGAAARAPQSVAAVVLYETSVAWVPGWDDGVIREVLGDEDPEGAGLRVMLGDRYDAMSDDERARRRVDASTFIAEEASVRTGTPPFAVADIEAPLVYGRSDARVMPDVIDSLRSQLPRMEVVTLPGAGHHAHRTAPEAFAGLVRRGLEGTAHERPV